MMDEAGAPNSDASAQISSVGEDENALRAALVPLPEYAAADWASSNLALVIYAAGEVDWAATSNRQRERAILMLSVRFFHAIRATMAVLGAGYEVEGRAMARLVIETRARLLEVVSDPSDQTARRWLEGKPRTTITTAIQASAPDLDPEVARQLYGGMSQDSHADVGGIMRSLASVAEDLTALIKWGPHRTADTQRSLLLCAVFAAEAATLLAAEAKVDHPNRGALAQYLRKVAADLALPFDL